LYYFTGCTNTTTSGCSTVSHLNMGNAPDALVFDPSNGDLYVGNVFDYADLSSAIAVISTATNTQTQTIQLGLSISSLALSSSGILFAGSTFDGTLYSISTSTGDVLGAVSLPTGADSMGQIAFDPTLNYLWITDETSNVDLVEDLSLGVNDPSSQPDVTGVGGTSLSTQEVAWGDGGGGISEVFDMPSYQTPLGVVANSSGTPCANLSGDCREVPDVSADADPDTGESVYVTSEGGWAEFGGTSLSSPIWAAALADISSADTNTAGFGLLNPSLYSLAQASPGTYFHDITAGENDVTGTNGGDFTAAPGYDMATGLGTLNAYALFVGLKGGHALVDVGMIANTRLPGQQSSWLFTATTSSSGALAASTGTIKIVAPTGSEFLPNSQVTVDSTVATTVTGTGTTTLTVTTPVSIALATTFTVNVAGMNPGAGNYANSFTFSTSSDATTTHLTQGYEVGSGVTLVGFSASNQIANATSTWTVQATTSASGALSAGVDFIDINAPTGTTFSSLGTYTVNGVTPGANDVEEGGSQIIIYTPVSIGNSSVITIVITDVTNPSGNFTSSPDFTVSTIADASGFASPGLDFETPTTSVSGVSFASSTLQGATTSNWTVQATTSATGALAGVNGTITITAPSGTNFQSSSVSIDGDITGSDTVSGGGDTVTFHRSDLQRDESGRGRLSRQRLLRRHE
jgi:hypothetical protein